MKEFKHITKHESVLIGSAVQDLETGHHLLYQRSKSQFDMIREVVDAKKSENPDDRQKEILELMRIRTDYDYAKENDVLSDDHIKWKDS